MGIEKQTQVLQYSLKEEIASRSMVITRTVTSNPINVTFSAIIYPHSTTYELDADNKKVDIYEEKDLGPIFLSPDQVMSLFTIPVTLKDGTQSYIGEVIANFADQIIANHVGMEASDVINTQNIDIAANSLAPQP